jgi:hypothetical protein
MYFSAQRLPGTIYRTLQQAAYLVCSSVLQQDKFVVDKNLGFFLLFCSSPCRGTSLHLWLGLIAVRGIMAGDQIHS